MMPHQHTKTLAFVADSTLGKLARHLRMAGFDTLQDAGRPTPERLASLSSGQRIILTRSTRVKRALDCERLVFIHDDRPFAQLNQVMTLFRVRREDLRPMTRCGLCNRILDVLARDEVRGRVPDYVWQHHARYKQCPGCKRIYWPGTHVDRWMKRMKDGY